MDAIVITLAGVPVGKGRPRFSRRTGHAFTPPRTRSYEAALRYAAQEAMGDRPPLEGALVVTVIARKPIPKSWAKKKKEAALAGVLRPTTRPDWDNIGKLGDAFNEIVWRDDAQVVDARVVKIYSDRPALEINVSPFVHGGGE